MADRMSILYLIMGPMAGGKVTGWGMKGAISPRYQGIAVIKPISLFRCPEAGEVIPKSEMISSRNTQPCLITPLSVEFLKDRPSVLIVPDFVYSFNTENII